MLFRSQALGGFLGFGRVDTIDGHPSASVVRFQSDGSLDPRFNALKSSDLASLGWIQQALALPDGKVLVAGIRSANSPQIFENLVMLIRLNPDGTQDPTFTPYRVLAGSDSVAVGSLLSNNDGSVLFAYATNFTTRVDRIEPNGRRDASWHLNSVESGVGSLQILPESRLFFFDGGNARVQSIGHSYNIDSVEILPHGKCSVIWRSTVGFSKLLEFSSDLIHWLPLVQISATECRGEYLHEAPLETSRFYRLRFLPGE